MNHTDLYNTDDNEINKGYYIKSKQKNLKITNDNNLKYELKIDSLKATSDNIEKEFSNDNNIKNKIPNYSKLKEELSISYISTLASYAHISYDIIRHDEDSTDGLLKKWFYFDDNKKFHSSMRIQLKATSSTNMYSDKGKYISYKLKKKNYDDLRTNCTIPIILCLLILPNDKNDWIKLTENELSLRRCMYWINLSNKEASPNKEHVTIKIDKEHIVTPDTLSELLSKIAKEGHL